MKYASLVLSLSLAILALAQSAIAEHLARRCQCGDCCQKVCRLVVETKKETKICYGVKCEDFCLPGRSCITGTKCVTDPCTGRCHREYCWQPNCGEVRTRRVLTKTPVTTEKTVYRCVVEDRCQKCGTAEVDQPSTMRLSQQYGEISPEVIPTSGELSIEEFERLVPRAALLNEVEETQDAVASKSAPKPAGRSPWIERLFSTR